MWREDVPPKRANSAVWEFGRSRPLRTVSEHTTLVTWAAVLLCVSCWDIVCPELQISALLQNLCPCMNVSFLAPYTRLGEGCDLGTRFMARSGQLRIQGYSGFHRVPNNTRITFRSVSFSIRPNTSTCNLCTVCGVYSRLSTECASILILLMTQL